MIFASFNSDGEMMQLMPILAMEVLSFYALFALLVIGTIVSWVRKWKARGGKKE